MRSQKDAKYIHYHIQQFKKCKKKKKKPHTHTHKKANRAHQDISATTPWIIIQSIKKEKSTKQRQNNNNNNKFIKEVRKP